MTAIETVHSTNGRSATRAVGHYCASGVTYGLGLAIQPPPPRPARASAADRAFAAWLRARIGAPVALKRIQDRLRCSQAEARETMARLVALGLAEEAQHRLGGQAWTATVRSTPT